MPKHKTMRVRVNANEISEDLIGLHVRKQYHPTEMNLTPISYIGLQGSTLTLLGLLKFDTEKREFYLDETSAFFAGGLAEAKKILKEVSSTYRYWALVFGGISALFLGLSFYLKARYR